MKLAQVLETSTAIAKPNSKPDEMSFNGCLKFKRIALNDPD